jgi:serine/threonine protein phosphatase PrpC
MKDHVTARSASDEAVINDERSVMAHFETTSITVAYRRLCEDRVKVIEFDEGVVIIIADGAGGTGAGGQAADAVIREVTAAASLEHDSLTWCGILRQTDFRIGAGESTCVVVARGTNGIVGASVGDSKAWLLENDDLNDLTKSQVRKPLLGTGNAQPVGFSHPSSPGLLLVCTDGFCNYVRREKLLKDILWIDFHVLPRKLVEMVRLPSGELWDDVGIVACRPRRPVQGRKRYEISV